MNPSCRHCGQDIKIEGFDLTRDEWVCGICKRIIRQAKAEAWDEGHRMGFMDGRENALSDSFTGPTPNPYREAAGK